MPAPAPAEAQGWVPDPLCHKQRPHTHCVPGTSPAGENQAPPHREHKEITGGCEDRARAESQPPWECGQHRPEIPGSRGTRLGRGEAGTPWKEGVHGEESKVKGTWKGPEVERERGRQAHRTGKVAG